ncbi:mRNA-capping enzyme subunit beta [Paramyrothecium foliicola]|nr:mRNA-capping enzyme subunit beta [Paramyrothecium foliicola]
MDLRSVLNTADNGERGASKAPPTPQQQHQARPSQSPAAQYPYRDYGHAGTPQQPHPGQDYPQHHAPHASPRQQHGGGSYPPQSPYQTPRPPPGPSPGPYPGRTAPPPLQTANSFHDVRSPTAGSMSAPSPYRQTPTPSTASAGAAGGYPFPAQSQEITSPVQRHQYPPNQYPQQQRGDGYPQGVAPHAAPAPYVQQHQPVPQTPPVATHGTQSYASQRSQSVHSTPTPTSAQSQHHFGHPQLQASPIATPRPLPTEYNRQPSQPPTPLGPPQPSVSRQSTASGSFAHPPSPYQQRASSTVSTHTAHAQPAGHSQHSQRMSGSQSLYGSPVPEAAHHRPPSNHEREHSLSVSPKTRVPSLPSNPDRPRTSSGSDARSAPPPQHMVVDLDRVMTPAKRKLDDRDLSPSELERKDTRPPPGAMNGSEPRQLEKSASPSVFKKNRVLRKEPPVWARSAHTLGNKLPSNPNFVLQKRAHQPVVNGKKDSVEHSRHPSPEASRTQHATQNQAQPPPEPGPQEILGPWEASITGVKPYEELSKAVADFLFIHVVNNPDLQEIMSRGIQFEIEAKLGTLIDKDTNMRTERLLETESVLRDNGRTAFRSSMTEAHHKAFNDFLNQVVIQTDPRAPNGGNRVQVHYKHRREVDRFFELPPELQGRIPGCVRSRLGARSRNVKVRVTYDQKTREVLGKIIKARVADIDLHMPSCPMDCRLSINLEMNWDGPVEELEQLAPSSQDRHSDRNKDRLSYKQGHYQIDLTQVTQTVSGPGNHQRSEKEHELEIELSPGILLDQGRKAMSGGAHRYQELVEGLVDNMRVLARKAREFA